MPDYGDEVEGAEVVAEAAGEFEVDAGAGWESVESLFVDVAATRLTLTRAIPLSVMPSCSAALLERSRLRPRMCGPRSLIRTVTDLPVVGLVTCTFEPIGNVLDAAVRSSGSYGSPLAVGRPAVASPWYDAFTALGALCLLLVCGGAGGASGTGAGAGVGGATAGAGAGCGCDC